MKAKLLKLITFLALASNCSSSNCEYKEIVELDLSDDFLRDHVTKGFTFRFNANKSSSKVKVSKAYLAGYCESSSIVIY